MLKFRSMYVDAEGRRAELDSLNERSEGLLFKIRDDPRITRFGKVLRNLSLDELPQLINVLCGHMSLVGPRPPLPAEVALYDDDVRRRLLVKPGLTGLWQISGRSDLTWEESVRLDLRYVENWSLSLDLLILWKTAFVVLRSSGAY
jgi:lipopolysaccharide/colanic/teichoic acid biosynthesis glycosyltransferase